MKDRAWMLEQMKRHGWLVTQAFGMQGPVLFIRGDFPGQIEMPVPVRLEDDHAKAMDSVYSFYAMSMEMHGRGGTA